MIFYPTRVLALVVFAVSISFIAEAVQNDCFINSTNDRVYLAGSLPRSGTVTVCSDVWDACRELPIVDGVTSFSPSQPTPSVVWYSSIEQSSAPQTCIHQLPDRATRLVQTFEGNWPAIVTGFFTFAAAIGVSLFNKKIEERDKRKITVVHWAEQYHFRVRTFIRGEAVDLFPPPLPEVDIKGFRDLAELRDQIEKKLESKVLNTELKYRRDFGSELLAIIDSWLASRN